MNDPRGSIWRKWDLHVHTRQDKNYTCLGESSLTSEQINELIKITGLSKAQITSQEQELSSEDYVKLLMAYLETFTNLSAIAVTNHNSGKDLDYLIGKIQKISFFPGVEVSSSHGIHIVCIFNPGIKWKDTWENSIDDFLTQIGIIGQRFDSDNNPLSSPKTSQNILEIVKKLNGICIFAHIQTENGLFKQSDTASGGTAHSNIYTHKLCNIVQLPSNAPLRVGVSNIIEGRDANYGSKTVTKIKCSDARKLSDIGKNSTWIKADLTFEGLKQIIYEPEMRVKIQHTNPELDYKKPFFSKIVLNEGPIFNKGKPQFVRNEFYLNRDLIAIIGGRGTGKSLLLDAVKKTFQNSDYFMSDARYSHINSKLDFSIYYKKEDGTETPYKLPEINNLDYLHVQQGEVKKIVENPERLDSEIKKLIGISKPKTKVDIEDEKTRNIIQAIVSNREWLERTDEQGNRINDVQYQTKQRKQYEEYIQTITTKENKVRISEYRQNSNMLDFLHDRLSQLEDLSASLDENEYSLNVQVLAINTLSVEVEWSENLDALVAENDDTFDHYEEDSPSAPDFLLVKKELNLGQRKRLIDILREEREAEIEDICSKSKYLAEQIPTVDFNKQREKAQQVKQKTNALIGKLEAENTQIREEFRKERITEEVATLLTKVDQYQTSIDDMNKKIKVIEARKKALSENYTTLFSIAEKFREDWERAKQDIEQKWKQLKDGGSEGQSPQQQLIDKLLADIEIKAEIHFDDSVFYNELQKCLDMRRFRSAEGTSPQEGMEKTFGVHCMESFLRLIKNEAVISSEDETPITLKQLIDRDGYLVADGQSELLRTLFLQENVNEYVRVLSKSTYKNKEPFELSVGQRGTFYVCLKLATDTFGLPFVFDQPEDDLDNDFIMNELVPIFMDIKKYRQIIIVTHNANLCVNADADQIIVAANKDEILSYATGALENPNIREFVYNILEGGEKAFLKREQKYAFSGTTS